MLTHRGDGRTTSLPCRRNCGKHSVRCYPDTLNLLPARRDFADSIRETPVGGDVRARVGLRGRATLRSSGSVRYQGYQTGGRSGRLRLGLDGDGLARGAVEVRGDVPVRPAEPQLLDRDGVVTRLGGAVAVRCRASSLLTSPPISTKRGLGELLQHIANGVSKE